MEYKFEVTVTVDDADRKSIIEMARRTYMESGGAFEADHNDVETRIPAEDYIDSIEEALSQLMFYGPYYEKEHPGIGCAGSA
jgi:hypothetical protein